MNNNFKQAAADASIVGMENLLLQLRAGKSVNKPKRLWQQKLAAFGLTGFDVLAAGLGGYAMVSGILANVAFLTNPVILAISVISSIFPALIVAGLDAWDSKKIFGINLFKSNQEEKALRQRIKLTQYLYQELNYQLTAKKIPASAIYLIKNLVVKNNQIINENYHKLYKSQQESLGHRIGRWSFLGINGALQFVGGLVLGKYVLGLTALAIMLPSPVLLGVAIACGILALTTFVALKKQTVFSIYNAITSRPNPLPEKQFQFIDARHGLKHTETLINKKIIDSKRHTKPKHNNQANFIIKDNKKIKRLVFFSKINLPFSTKKYQIILK